MLRQRIIQTFETALENMADNGRMELAKQGHRASGRLINSLEGKITSADLDRLVGVILAEDYGLIVDSGVPASRVPFSGAGGGGTSRYIQGLLDWVDYIKPGLSDREKKSFVFAVAHTHKRQGIPSRGSYSFSGNGRRKGWIEHGLESQAEQLEKDLRLVALITESFEAAVAQAAA